MGTRGQNRAELDLHMYEDDKKYSNSPGGHAVPPYVTLSILVAGVLGGLAIVIAVILFCKYCVKKNKGPNRDELDSRRLSDRERRYNKPLQRYETINSDMFSEPSTGSLDGLPISPRKLFEARSAEHYTETDEINETTRLRADFERVSYKELATDQDVGLDYVKTEEDMQTRHDTSRDSEKSSRRVSFQLDNLPHQSPIYLRKGRRYTDGDFHHLKRARIEKGVPRQYSLGTKTIPERGSNSPLSDRRPSLDLRKDYENLYQNFEVQMCADSPSPSVPSKTTEICVEIHQHFNNRKDSDTKTEISKMSLSPGEKGRRMSGHSRSLDATSYKTSREATSRKSRSVDDVVDYDILKITEFKGPFNNTDFNAISELGSPGGSKVRYNDTGSIEQLDEENLDSLDFYEEFEMDSLRLDESDDTETLNGTQKYRELWNLRTTFEEEEECSDTIRMEDMTSPDQSPDGDMPQYYTTSFESNTESIPYTDNSDKQRKLSVLSVDIPKPLSSNLLHPNYENRRQTYKNILARRFLPGAGGVSTETSIDSVETVDTDGEVSDTSRYEVTTTSFDSTTDNTDSANESQNHRLIQMKADSGYKSLETQPFLHGAVKRNHSTGEIEEETEDLDVSTDKVFKHAHSLPEPGPSGSRFFDRRNGKTASKKRREYSREKQIVHVYESINEPELDQKSDQPSGESFEETPPVNKLSMFSRFFKIHKDIKHRTSSLVRDYSIDEKTNRVFQEFLRYDPKLDSRASGTHHGRPHRIHRHRLHRKHSDVKYFEDRRRDRLTPDLRSTSLGSDSSTSSVRRLSPQDSIEEEDYNEMREEEEWERQMQQREIQQRQSVSIPIIKLPEEESTNV